VVAVTVGFEPIAMPVSVGPGIMNTGKSGDQLPFAHVSPPAPAGIPLLLRYRWRTLPRRPQDNETWEATRLRGAT
jgi:hypothetical protein